MKPLLLRDAFILFLLLSFLPGQPSRAAETEVLAGIDANTEGEGFGYIGTGLLLPVTGQWIVLTRVMGGYLRYKFESEGSLLTADSPSVTPSVGLRHHLNGRTATLLIGADLRQVDREGAPGKPGTTDRDAGIFLQGEGDMWVRSANMAVIASYSSIDDFFWSRGRVKHPVAHLALFGENILSLGGEAVGMGNADFNAVQLGGIVEFHHSASHLSLTLKGGYRHASSLDDSGYGGIELYKKY